MNSLVLTGGLVVYSFLAHDERASKKTNIQKYLIPELFIAIDEIKIQFETIQPYHKLPAQPANNWQRLLIRKR